MKIENWMLLVNPDAITDNLWFINFQKKKARSMTTTKTGALKWLLWVDISKDRLESLQFDKSYTMEEWGSRFLPTQFSPNSQWETVGWLYNEDTEFISPDFKGNSNSQSNPAEAYNQCSSYWSDIKNLAYYSQKCGDDVSDEQTQNWVKVDSWNAEGSLPEFSEWANKNKCGRFANAKKKYKEKYKDNWEKFYADFGTYARTPEGVNVEVLCKGVELEHGAAFDWFKNNDNVKQRWEVLSWMIKGNKSMAEALQDDRRIIIKWTGENAITRWDYLDDTRYLRDLLSQCRWLKFRGLYTGELVQDSQYYCSLYEIQKQTLIAKYAWVDFQSHNLTSLEKFITRIENIANQWLVSHTVDELKKMWTNILSDLWNQLYSYIQDPYMSGFYQISFIQCNNAFQFPQLDILMYVLFVAFFFLIFKYI